MTQCLSLKKKPYNSDDATPTHNPEVFMWWEYFQRQNGQLIYFLGIHLLYSNDCKSVPFFDVSICLYLYRKTSATS